MTDWQDHAALARLYSLFSHARDDHRHDEWLSLFTEDGVFDIDTGAYHGQDALRTFSQGLEAALTSVRMGIKHCVSDIDLTIEGDHANGRTYFQFYKIESGVAVLGALGTYTDRFRRVNGTWKIEKRVVRNDTDPVIV